MKVRERFRDRGCPSAWLLLAASMAAGLIPVSGRAQEAVSAPFGAREPRGRLGVFLEEGCAVWSEVRSPRAPADASCPVPPVVASVIVGSAADRAGVRSRDTLLAIDGRPLTSAEGRRALASLVPGRPVAVDIGRREGRIRLKIVPRSAPRGGRVRVRTRWTARDGAEERVIEIPAPWIVRVPEDRADRGQLQASLDSLSTAGQAFVLFSEDSTGALRLEIASSKDATSASEGPSRRWSSAYVWTDENLARRLERVRETSLRTARVRLDSLARLHRRLQESLPLLLGQEERSLARLEEMLQRLRAPGEVEGGAGGERRVASPLPTGLADLFVTDRRVAGAEFRPLTPELAEYFQGANGGLLVMRVLPGTPAARLGLRGGDVVTEIDGRACRDVATLRSALQSADPDAPIEVKWIRKGKRYDGILSGS